MFRGPGAVQAAAGLGEGVGGFLEEGTSDRVLTAKQEPVRRAMKRAAQGKRVQGQSRRGATVRAGHGTGWRGAGSREG